MVAIRRSDVAERPAATRPAFDSLSDSASSGRDAALRFMRSTGEATRPARHEARLRASAAVGAIRGERPTRRWPLAVMTLGVGVGVGFAVGILAATRNRSDMPEEMPDPGQDAQMSALHPEDRQRQRQETAY